MLRRLADTDHTFGVVTYRLVLQMHAMIPMGLAPFQLPVESVSVSLESVTKSLWVAFSQFLCGICPRKCCQESLGCLFAVPLWNLSQRVLPRVSGLPFCSSSVEPVSESVAKSLWVAFLQFLCGTCLRECCQESLGCLFAVPLWNLSQRVLPRVWVAFLQFPCGICLGVSGELPRIFELLFCSSSVESVSVSVSRPSSGSCKEFRLALSAVSLWNLFQCP